MSVKLLAEKAAFHLTHRPVMVRVQPPFIKPHGSARAMIDLDPKTPEPQRLGRFLLECARLRGDLASVEMAEQARKWLDYANEPTRISQYTWPGVSWLEARLKSLVSWPHG